MKYKSFSSFLVSKRDAINLTNSKLASLANISAVYLGEIIKKKKNPPDKKTQYALADALQLSEEEKFEFFDLAASERREIPVDIYDYLLEREDLLEEIRAKKMDEGKEEHHEKGKTNKEIN